MIVEIVYILLIIVAIYFGSIFALAVLSTKIKRKPYKDFPDWGTTVELKIPTEGNKYLDAWLVYSDNVKIDQDSSNGIYKPDKTVILLHGWDRSKERMVSRARFYNELNYSSLIISARDHGNSSRERFGMNLLKFSQDLGNVIQWWSQPILIHGHSIGAGASLNNGSNKFIKGVIADAPPRNYPRDLYDFYKPILKILNPIIFPGFYVLLKILLSRWDEITYNPYKSTKNISVPILISYGKLDQVFQYSYGYDFEKVNSNVQFQLLEDVNHSNFMEQNQYKQTLRKFIEDIE